MHRPRLFLPVIAAMTLVSPSKVAPQARPLEPDLAQLAADQGLQVFNRSVTSLVEATRKGLRLNESPGDGIAYLKGVEFSRGTIECELRGKDVQGQSFVGIVFHGVDGTTYDAIYFRPFNFQAADTVRRAHSVQYISHPVYTWQKLRAEHPGVYERPVNPVPDPTTWFHVRIVVAGSKVSVFVADATEPSLEVTLFSERTRGFVGLWVGNTSGGDFANLRILPE